MANSVLGSGTPIQAAEFQALSRLVTERFGIQLPESKRAMLVGRLQRILREKGFASFSDYYDYVVGDKTGKALSDLVDRVSTNHTYFWREHEHFDFFRDTVVPERAALRKSDGDLRFWCAGCSSGEEAYTLQILMREALGRGYSQWKAGLLATDISDRVLTSARAGIYEADQLENAPSNWMRQWFEAAGAGRVRARDALRSDLVFRRFNLMNAALPFKKSFDAIFCRNVMIYFDTPTKAALVRRFIGHLLPGAYLFIGHSESLGASFAELKYLRPSVYQRV
jgi:chemotaxis protein methyltransferase CheR